MKRTRLSRRREKVVEFSVSIESSVISDEDKILPSVSDLRRGTFVKWTPATTRASENFPSSRVERIFYNLLEMRESIETRMLSRPWTELHGNLSYSFNYYRFPRALPAKIDLLLAGNPRSGLRPVNSPNNEL